MEAAAILRRHGAWIREPSFLPAIAAAGSACLPYIKWQWTSIFEDAIYQYSFIPSCIIRGSLVEVMRPKALAPVVVPSVAATAWKLV